MTLKNVFILGTGFSVEHGAPVLKDFLEKSEKLLIDPESDLSPEEKEYFQEVFKYKRKLESTRAKIKIDLDNIENLFSILDMDFEFGNNKLNKMRDKLIFLIVKTLSSSIKNKELKNHITNLELVYFKTAGSISPSKYMELFNKYGSSTINIYDGFVHLILGDLQKNYTENTIISFNYDCIVEKYLIRNSVLPEYCINAKWYGNNFGIREKKFKILKVHGSMNWYFCPNCNDYIILLNPADDFLGKFSIKANCEKCKKEVSMTPLIIPPTWNKVEHKSQLKNVWRETLIELFNARNIIVIGYSIPDTDLYFRYLLTLALSKNHNLKRIFFINPDPKANNDFKKLFDEVTFREHKKLLCYKCTFMSWFEETFEVIKLFEI